MHVRDLLDVLFMVDSNSDVYVQVYPQDSEGGLLSVKYADVDEDGDVVISL